MVWGELWCLAGPAGCQAMTDSSVSQDYLACNNASLCSYDVATLLELLFPLLCTSFRQRSSSPSLHPIIVPTSSRYSRAFMHRTRGVGGCGVLEQMAREWFQSSFARGSQSRGSGKVGRLCTGLSRLRLHVSNPRASGKLRPSRNTQSCLLWQLFLPVTLVSNLLHLRVLKKKKERI